MIDITDKKTVADVVPVLPYALSNVFRWLLITKGSCIPMWVRIVA